MWLQGNGINVNVRIFIPQITTKYGEKAMDKQKNLSY